MNPTEIFHGIVPCVAPLYGWIMNEQKRQFNICKTIYTQSILAVLKTLTFEILKHFLNFKRLKDYL